VEQNMVGSDQGGRSSRPHSTVHPGWRAKLRRLDRRCSDAARLIWFQKAVGRNSDAAERIYQKADMERMLIRRKIKAFVK
jgi:hypothetical protein